MIKLTEQEVFNPAPSKYIIDTKTTNKSFIRMYDYLKKRGIENNKFHLRLYNAELQGVDPLNPSKLTTRQKRMILEEMRVNPFYTLREIIRIEGPGGLARFQLHPGNLAIIWAILNSIDIIVLLPRQQGKTIAVAAILNWLYNFGTINTAMLFGNKSLKDAKNNLKRLKDITDFFPDYIKEAVFNIKNDVNNLESIASGSRNNRISVAGSPRSIPDADNLGRGMSIPIWWPDEIAFLKYNKIIYDAATPAISTASRIAEERGVPHAKILTTTPSNLDLDEGAFVKFLIDLSCTFIEEMYDWPRFKILDYIYNNSTNNFVFIKYTWQDLGLTKEWYERQCRELNYDWLKINREVNLQWSKSTENSVFNEEQLEAINQILKSSIGTKIIEATHHITPSQTYKESYGFKLYQELNPNREYAIGVDVSSGQDRDNSAVTIVDPDKEFEVVGVFKSPNINTDQLSHLLITLIKNHLPNSTLIIENNSYGKAIIDTCMKYIPKNVYTHYGVPNDKKHKKHLARDERGQVVYGISTNTQSRPLMIEIVSELVTKTPSAVAYPELYTDIRALEYKSNGKIEHQSGMHDDTLMSYLMVRYAFAYTNNLKSYFKSIYVPSERTRVYSEDPTKYLGLPPDLERIQAIMDTSGVTLFEAIAIYTKETASAVKNGNGQRVNVKAVQLLGRKGKK